MLVHGWWSITCVLNVCTTCNNWVVDLPSTLHTSNCLERNCFSALMMFRVIGMNNETSINMWLNSLALEKKERKKERIAAAAAVYAVHQCRTWKACSWN